MPNVRIWTLESDYDARAVKCLADKLARYLRLDHLSIRWADKKAFRAANKRNRTRNDGLKTAVINYLKEDTTIVFVIDHDSRRSMFQRRKETNSLINQIERVTRDRSFRGKVFLALAVQELESWLLIDCLGISCYFASTRKRYRDNCRDRVSENRSFVNLVRRRQRGDTEQIVEAESGGKGPKEYLTSFTEEILLELNPRMSQKDVQKARYSERLSPEIAEHVVISQDTLRRNKSLRHLGDLLGELG